MTTTRARFLCAGLVCLTAISMTAEARKTHPQAILSFSANQPTYEVGQKAQLSWASSNTRFCVASGDWDGKFGGDGAYWTPPLDGPKTFHLKCASKGGGVTATVQVAVTSAVPEPEPLPPEPEPTPEPTPEPIPEPAPEPTVALRAGDNEVTGGSSTTLTWSSTDASSCATSWGSSTETSGFETVGPINETTSYSLTCSGDGGSGTASVQVAVAPSEPDPVPTPEPTVAISAADTEVAGGASTLLSWSSTDASSCQASGWAGTLAPSGSMSVGPINSTTTYSLSCSGAGGTAAGSVRVTVVPPPTVSLSAADGVVPAGGSTTLSWNSTNAGGCEADGGWTGSKGTSGSTSVGPINGATTFSLSCSGTGGNAMQMVSVSARGEVSISWVKPNENVDGTPLNDLNKFWIYYGTESRNYSGSIEVTDPNATTHAFPATSGEYFVSMTAEDRDGNESAFSNEIQRTVP